MNKRLSHTQARARGGRLALAGRQHNQNAPTFQNELAFPNAHAPMHQVGLRKKGSTKRKHPICKSKIFGNRWANSIDHVQVRGPWSCKFGELRWGESQLESFLNYADFGGSIQSPIVCWGGWVMECNRACCPAWHVDGSGVRLEPCPKLDA